MKLLLVAVRQMRRTFAQPRKTDPALEAYASSTTICTRRFTI
ncbi:MAG: hypothetical protein WDO73_33245 [Ignavibacteriota bacterium]